MAKLKYEISVERIKEVLNYDPLTGIFTWKKATAKYDRTGQKAGSVDHRGYLFISLDKRDFIAQRLAWILMKGEIPPGRIVLRDKNPLNLKWDNLALHRGISGFDHHTPEGKSAYGKAWRAANPEKAKDRSLRQDFGISFKEYEEMLKAQNGCCAICGNGETLARNGKQLALAVDHHHATGYVRELLCRGCNQGIGNFKENPEVMQNAIAYLKKHAAKHTEDNVVPLRKGSNHDS